ncbi:MAG: sulfatase [Pirellulales bacterium]|nr:sulfatase [Pirellulales bacterium]
MMFTTVFDAIPDFASHRLIGRTCQTGNVKPMIRLAAALLLVVTITMADRWAWSAQRPNILFIFTDDHACQSIGAYGSKINQTPHIDRLAREGAVFTNSFCANSICGPSRACVLTGKHSHKNGFYSNGRGPFNGRQFTFPQALQKAGYQTAMIGKWHLNSTPTGFDHWDILPGQGAYYNPDFINAAGKRRIEGYCTTITTDLAIEWLDQRDSDQPFLLMCQHKAPHRTWAPDLKYLHRYSDQDIAEPATLFDDWKNRSSTLATNAMSIDRHFYYHYDLKVHQPVPFASEREQRLKDGEYRRMTPAQRQQWDAAFKPRNDAFLKAPPTGKDLVRWKYQRYIKNYLRCIDSVDESVGRLLGYLDSHGLADNTIVIYSSDQGFYLGEHGWYDKRWMFEESLKMPFVIRWPGKIEAGTQCDKLIQNIDYAPTFLEAAGLDVPDEIQGRSLMALFREPGTADWRRSIYYHYYEHGGEHQVPRHEGVRTDRFKLINFYSSDGLNLFDLENDPLEMQDVSRNPDYAEILKMMKAELERQRQHYDLPPLSP